MSLCKFAALPSALQNNEVARYYVLLEQKRATLWAKRACDVILSAAALPVLALPMLCIAGAVALDSPGPALYRQRRVGRYARPFTIYKFRTMVHAPAALPLTRRDDGRVTRVGAFLRRRRLDELPQLWNVLRGDLSLVGPRPEVERYVAHYDDAMLATLLVRPGLASPAALAFANEAALLDTDQAERVYVELLLPRKAAMNLDYLKELSLRGDVALLFKTLGHCLGRGGV